MAEPTESELIWFLKLLKTGFIISPPIILIGFFLISVLSKLTIREAVPSIVFNTIFPLNPSAITTSAKSLFNISLGSTFPTKLIFFNFSSLSKNFFVSAFPLLFSSPIFKSPTLGLSIFKNLLAKTLPITANCAI